jgi:hypothetical protein
VTAEKYLLRNLLSQRAKALIIPGALRGAEARLFHGSTSILWHPAADVSSLRRWGDRAILEFAVGQLSERRSARLKPCPDTSLQSEND